MVREKLAAMATTIPHSTAETAVAGYAMSPTLSFGQSRRADRAAPGPSGWPEQIEGSHGAA